ncbi:hypothetical protein HG530_005589 [Fusarium avenaceum]|nr:hypothetical protein HG530_005589 [Fusarium avenaceum]
MASTDITSTSSLDSRQINCAFLITKHDKLKLLPSSGSFVITPIEKGIRLYFPRDSNRTVFTWYSPDTTLTSSDNYHITIEIPTGGFVEEIRQLTEDETRTLGLAPHPDLNNFHVLNIKLLQNFSTNIVGFGLPFDAATDEVHGWVNNGAPIHGVASLAEILQQNSFTILLRATEAEVARWVQNMNIHRTTLDYGYGKDQTWNLKRYEKQIPNNRGLAFTPTIRFEDTNQRDTALTQVHVQDKINEESERGSVRFACLLEPGKFYKGKHWRAVTRGLRGDRSNMTIRFMNRAHGEVWEAKHLCYGLTKHLKDVIITDRIPLGLIQPPKGQPGHAFSPIHHDEYPGVEMDVTRDAVRLCFQRNMKGEKNRVDAVNRLSKKPWPCAIDISAPRKQAIFNTLLVGQGIWASSQLGLNMEFPPLDLFHDVPVEVQDACLELVFEDDRDRARQYFSKLHFGFGLVSGPPGSGKSNLASVLTILMCYNESIKRVYVSAASNEATTNILNRMDSISTDITHNLNGQHKGLMLVRGFSHRDEVKNCLDALSGISFEDDAVWNPTPWRFKLSLCWWTLRALGASTVPPLTPDDNQELWDLHQQLNALAVPGPVPNAVSEFEPLVKIAQGPASTIPKAHSKKLSQLMKLVLDCADVVATTPAASNSKMYKSYNAEKARAVVFDEAATMFLSDGLMVFGNTPRPMIAIGDPEQLAPVLPTEIEMLHDKRDKREAKDLGESNFPTNRFAKFAQLSWLTHFIHLGWPVFHLYTQHRMVKGLFDMSIDTVYRDIKPQFKYSPLCELVNFPIAVKVEKYMNINYHVPSCTAGRLQPIFFDCRDCPSCNFPNKASRLNPRQADCMAKFLIEMISDLSLDPADIAVLTPYVANRGAIRKRFFKDDVLKKIQCSTFDGFQGKEAQVVLVSLCVDQKTGPSFVGNPRKLNVALTRQRSSLLIFGDLGMNRYEFREKQEAESKNEGSDHFDHTLFRTVFRMISDSRRIVTLYGDLKIDLSVYEKRLQSSSEFL